MGDNKLITATQGIKIHIEMDFDDLIGDGYSRSEAIRKVAKSWSMTHEEVNDIIQAYEHEMEDIDKNGDLGDIL